jgi:hypothetical protein
MKNNTKLQSVLDNLHFPLWILKDMAWMMKFGTISALLAIPTIIISLILIRITKGVERKQNMVILCWLSANTLWMSEEIFHTPTLEFSFIFFLLGILISLTYIPKLIMK